jgi:hypothetical protein
MARRVQSKGDCVYCKRPLSRGGMARHLPTCKARQQAVTQAKGKGTQSLYHVQVQDTYGDDYWLHLEINGDSTLETLDDYLRMIWLECCGHLSHFAVGNAWGDRELAMNRKIHQVLQPGVELVHVYDYGTTSETHLKVVAVRQGQPLTKHPITLMARNHPQTVSCMECDQAANWLCIECIYEEEGTGFLCDDHLEEHPHDDYGEPVSLVNSPRMGMCGYDGPAETPYGEG